MLDYLYEMKTSRINRTLDSHQFRKENDKDIFSQTGKTNANNSFSKERSVKPIEMKSVHIELKNENSKKKVFSLFKRK